MLLRDEKSDELSRDKPMDMLMAENPQVIAVLIKNKMHCVGCLLAPFHNITDAAFEHELDEDILLDQLRDALASNSV
ncbi:MAG: DUF1858 domain-containing protein [Salaquimonas sp.]